MKEPYYFTSEMVVGNLFIILIENGYNKPITWGQMREFVNILTKEMAAKEISFRYSDLWDEPIDQCDLFIATVDKIILRRTLIDLMYKVRLYEREDILEILESESLENKTLEMVGIKKRSKKTTLGINEYICKLEDEIELCALKKNYVRCVELTEEIERIKEIDSRIKRYQLCIQKNK